jgi:hypothetical protein
MIEKSHSPTVNSAQVHVTKMTHLAGNRMKNNEITGSRNFGGNFSQNHRIVDFKGLQSGFSK